MNSGVCIMSEKCDCGKICNCDEAYKNGRRDMKKEIQKMLIDQRFPTLGVVRATLTDIIEKVGAMK